MFPRKKTPTVFPTARRHLDAVTTTYSISSNYFIVTVCSPWPFLSLVFNTDAKLQKAAAVFWSFLRSSAGREKDLHPGVWDTGSRSPWVSSSKAKMERCFCRTLSPPALLGVFADLQWAPHLQPSTGRKSSLSC